MKLDPTPQFEAAVKQLLTMAEKRELFGAIEARPHDGEPPLDQFPDEYGHVLMQRYPAQGESQRGHILLAVYGIHDNGTIILLYLVETSEWEEWVNNLTTENVIRGALEGFARLLRGGM